MIGRVTAILDRAGIDYCLIGGTAVGLRGHVRFTIDIDLLTTDRRVLQAAMWNDVRESGVPVDVRTGDFDDPLAGVVRIGRVPDQVDIVVGRWKWEQRVIERAQRLDVGGVSIPVPLASDLILLKLAAGGPIDQQDIIRLLAIGPRDPLIAAVNEEIAELPPDARPLWERIVAETA